MNLAEDHRRRLQILNNVGRAVLMVVFNILCGNADDHARNHAAFFGMGKTLTLTPTYDICPGNASGRRASQAMMIAGNDRSSRLITLSGRRQKLYAERRSGTKYH